MAAFCVIGAGVIGLSSALNIAKQCRGCRMTIIYAHSSPDTNSNHGFGICGALHLDKYDCPKYVKWAKLTTQYLQRVIETNMSHSTETGVRERTMYIVRDKDSQNQYAETHLLEISRFSQPATQTERKSIGLDAKELEYVLERTDHCEDDASVLKIGNWVIDPDYYLAWLLKELKDMEARNDIAELRLINRQISDFSDVMEDGVMYDCIINCSGLASRYLVPDNKVVPIRGQYLIMDASDVSDLIRSDCDRATFICPMLDKVKVGPTHQVGRNDTALDPNDTRELLRRCESLCPKLRHRRIIKEAVGIRPGRIGGPRLGVEFREFPSSDRPVPVIHNYGHGSKGFIQHWGCAMETAELVMRCATRNAKL